MGMDNMKGIFGVCINVDEHPLASVRVWVRGNKFSLLSRSVGRERERFCEFIGRGNSIA